MTLLEAMAMGLPVVASRLDGIAEVIDDPDDGLLAPPDNADLFVDHVTALISNRELAMGIAKKARAKIERRFSVERLTAAVESIYDRHLP